MPRVTAFHIDASSFMNVFPMLTLRLGVFSSAVCVIGGHTLLTYCRTASSFLQCVVFLLPENVFCQTGPQFAPVCSGERFANLRI